MTTPITKGTHHIGLTVSKLEESAYFFISLLGWKEFRRNEEYPAIFVSDGNIMVTLWAIKEQPSNQFNKNKNKNVGLHHVAFHLESESELNNLYEKLESNGVYFIGGRSRTKGYRLLSPLSLIVSLARE